MVPKRTLPVVSHSFQSRNDRHSYVSSTANRLRIPMVLLFATDSGCISVHYIKLARFLGVDPASITPRSLSPAIGRLRRRGVSVRVPSLPRRVIMERESGVGFGICDQCFGRDASLVALQHAGGSEGQFARCIVPSYQLSSPQDTCV